MNTLYVFDVDGTLTKTNTIDESCFVFTAEKLLGVKDFSFRQNNNWHYTDSFIAHKLLSLNKLESDNLSPFKDLFIQNLQNATNTEPEQFSAVEGGVALIHTLSELKIPLALATGCWKQSAELKLKAAGYTLPELPFTTADNHYTRYEIITQAIIESEHYYKREFDRIIYIGDGIWDKITCARLGLDFIGIEAENNNDKAKALEPHLLLRYYPEVEDFLAITTKASVPSEK